MLFNGRDPSSALVIRGIPAYFAFCFVFGLEWSPGKFFSAGLATVLAAGNRSSVRGGVGGPGDPDYLTT